MFPNCLYLEKMFHTLANQPEAAISSISVSVYVYLTSPLTMWLMTDSASQLFLTLCGFPEAVSVKVDTRATGVIRGPATEHSVAVVSPTVVDPILNTKPKTTGTLFTKDLVNTVE